MRVMTAGKNRETLLQDINNALLQWPEVERRIFSQAHYHGESPETISQSVQLDAKEVNNILKRCERRLYAYLRSYQKNGNTVPRAA